MRRLVLHPRMKKLVLERLLLVDAIAEVLPDRLASADICQPSLHALVHVVIDDEKTILHHIITELHALKGRSTDCLKHLHGLLNMKGFHALQIYRSALSLW